MLTKLFSTPTTDQKNAASAALPNIASALAAYDDNPGYFERPAIISRTLLPLALELSPLYFDLVEQELEATIAAADAALTPLFPDETQREQIYNTMPAMSILKLLSLKSPSQSGAVELLKAAQNFFTLVAA